MDGFLPTPVEPLLLLPLSLPLVFFGLVTLGLVEDPLGFEELLLLFVLIL